MRILVTGAAGFIGSNLVDALLLQGNTVIGIDNMSTGREVNLPLPCREFVFHRGDLHDGAWLDKCFNKVLGEGRLDCVFHLAANADIRDGLKQPMQDLKQNTIVTANVLHAMRQMMTPNLVFTSTGSVYGETSSIPTAEDAPFPIQTSLYGASKLACEGLISAFSAGFSFKARVLRLVSVLGPRYSHGHVLDFWSQLKKHPDRLDVLGNGKQCKSYIHVKDVVRALIKIAAFHSGADFQVYNVGTDEEITVQQSAAIISQRLGLKPTVNFQGGARGWVGDIPRILLHCGKLRAQGWSPKYSIEEAIVDTVDYLERG